MGGMLTKARMVALAANMPPAGQTSVLRLAEWKTQRKEKKEKKQDLLKETR
jgi:hypothetical protein